MWDWYSRIKTACNYFRNTCRGQAKMGKDMLSFRPTLRPLNNKHTGNVAENVTTTTMAQTVENLPTVWETWVWSLGWEGPLEEGMATHSSILAWRIPVSRGGWRALQSMGSQSVRHSWATKPATETRAPRQSPKTGIPAGRSGADWDCGARGRCPGRGTCSQKLGVLGCGLCLPGETTQWPLLQSSALTHPLHFDLMAHLPGSEKCVREACLLNRGLGKRKKKITHTKFKPRFCMLACGLSLYFLWMWVLTETSTGELVSGLLKPLVSWAGERKKLLWIFYSLVPKRIPQPEQPQ